MMKGPNSMLSTICLVVATRVMEKKKSLLQEYETSTKFLNESDTNPLRALRIVGWVFVKLVLEDCCVSTSCGCCTLLVQLVADPVVHLHPRRLIRVSTISRFGFFHFSSQRKSGPLLRSLRILSLSQARCKMSVCDDCYLDNKR